MSRKFKAQASSARAASGALGSHGFGFGGSAGLETTSSPLSYIAPQPDLSGISEPGVVVSFKNLGKKDSVTKAKALEELQDYLSSEHSSEVGVDTAFLEAWISLYPRTSIDNARRVRMLAHSLQGTIAVLSGKRLVPHLSKLVGPWLSGTFDSDRAVAKSAQEALEKTFASKEKRLALWKIYRESIAQYADDATLSQTPQTLSDERTTSPDDAEAKYVRVAGNAIALLQQLLEVVHVQNAVQDLEAPLALVQNENLWHFAYYNDAQLRRSVYRLLVFCCDNYPSSLPWSSLSTSLLSKALPMSQLGSTGRYVEALKAVTRVRSQIWTDDYHAKTPVARRFLQFLRSGSQRGTPDYWTAIETLVREIPMSAWSPSDAGPEPITCENCQKLLQAIHEGIQSSEEPRPNLATAWQVYTRLTFWLVESLGKGQSSDDLISECLIPLVDQYIAQALSQSQWTMPSNASLKIVADILMHLASEDDGVLAKVWQKQTETVIDTMKLSLPETTKDFQKSQNLVIDMGTRMANLQKAVLKLATKEDTTAIVQKPLQKSVERLVDAAMEILKMRNGKPFGAAGVLEMELQLLDNLQESTRINDFLTDTLPQYMCSPSAERLIAVLFLCRGCPNFGSSLRACLTNLDQLPESAQRETVLTRFLGSINAADLGQGTQIRELVLGELDLALKGNVSRWVPIKALINNHLLSALNVSNGATSAEDHDLKSEVLTQLISGLSVETSEDTALSGLDVLLTDRTAFRTVLSLPTQQDLLSKLLLLTDSPKELTSDLATKTLSKLKGADASKSSSITSSTLDLIKQQHSGSAPLISIFSLVDLARELHENAAEKDKEWTASALLPTSNNWQQALSYFKHVVPNAALAITSPLQGLVFAVQADESKIFSATTRDSEDLSMAFRLALYVTKLAPSINILGFSEIVQKQDIALYLPQVLELVNEKVTLDSANSLWKDSTPEVLEEAAELLVNGRNLLYSLPPSRPSNGQRGDSSVNLEAFWSEQLSSMTALSPQSYHLSQTFVSIMSGLPSLDKQASYVGSLSEALKVVRRSEDLFKSGAILIAQIDAATSSNEGRRLCNELVAEITELQETELTVKALRPLSMLNIMLQTEASLLDSLPSQRMVFLLKNLLTLLHALGISTAMQSEITKLLSYVLPTVQDIYGEHWEELLSYLTNLWNELTSQDASLPLIHSSMRLFAGLRKLNAGDVNEDLQDAWQSSKPGLQEAIVRLLAGFQSGPDGLHQPREITVQLLRRQLAFLEGGSTADLDSIYQLMTSPETAIHGAAFDLLHNAIPTRQEQISLNVALEGEIARLPSELLALIAQKPDMDLLATTLKSDRMWIAIRRYLLSWQLVFDHFEEGSHKVREMYADAVKSSGHLVDLLDLVCDLIRVTSSRPIDASKFDLSEFSIDISENYEKEATWLAVLLYRDALLFVPAVCKDWFIQQKNRVKGPLESWTQKFISPTIVAKSLASVNDWATTQDADDRPISIKSSLKGAELTASITIDEESPPISLAISLPGAYPLAQAVVASRNRVGVSEKNWQSWLRTIQIIVFSTGSLIEGLVAFRRNVQGALKGQTECAICYSIIGTDMQTPSKKCGTCKNGFHSTCLFRWFKNSNSSSCPLCRNNFNYA